MIQIKQIQQEMKLAKKALTKWAKALEITSFNFDNAFIVNCSGERGYLVETEDMRAHHVVWCPIQGIRTFNHAELEVSILPYNEAAMFSR